MYEMRNMLCSKLKLPFTNKGGFGREEDRSSLMSKANVKEEYKEAFRTKSYIEICNKVQDLVRVVSLDDEKLTTAMTPPSIHHIHLSEYLLDPYRKPSTSTFDSSNFGRFFTNYFEVSQEACMICESLLANLKQVRKNHRRIKKAIKIIRRISHDGITDRISDFTDEGITDEAVCKNLASFAAQRNPFSTTSERFLNLHETHVVLFQELTSKYRKLKRRTRIIKFIKKALAISVLIGFGAFVVVAIALAVQCTAGLAAAPGLIVLSMMATKLKRNCDEKWLDAAAAKVDAAARGVFTMINDLATLSRIVKRLEDEIEHRRHVADVCVRKGKNETLKEVVREFEVNECWFAEQLEELEREIYLCFLDINRSRRLLVREFDEV